MSMSQSRLVSLWAQLKDCASARYKYNRLRASVRTVASYCSLYSGLSTTKSAKWPSFAPKMTYQDQVF